MFWITSSEIHGSISSDHLCGCVFITRFPVMKPDLIPEISSNVDPGLAAGILLTAVWFPGILSLLLERLASQHRPVSVK